MNLAKQSYTHQRLQRMYGYPANYELALLHKNAFNFGYSNPKMKDGSNTPICPCCQNYINTVSISVKYSTLPNTNPQKEDQVFLLPADVSLYFTFIKMVIIFIAFRFLTVDLYNIMTSLSGHYCQQIYKQGQISGNICSSLNISLMSGFNKHTKQDLYALQNLAYLNLAFTILSLAYIFAYRIYSYKLFDFLENNDVTEDDFTLLVQNIPPIIFDKEHSTVENCHINYEYFLRKTFEQKIRDWLKSIEKKEKNSQKNRLSRLQRMFYKDIYSKKKAQQFNNLQIIHNIIICYDLTELQNLNNKRDKLVKDFISLNGQANKKYNNQLEYIPNQMKIINSKYTQLCHKFANEYNSASALSKFVGKAFITFEYQHYKSFILSQSEKNKKFITLNNQALKISQAPKPNDVFWENMKLTDQQRRNHVYYSYQIMLMALAFFFATLILIKLFQEEAKRFISTLKVNKKMANFLFNLSMIFLTNLFNGILDGNLQKLTDLQKHQSKTRRVSSMIIKNVIAKFVNTTVIYFILFRLNPVNPVSRQGLVQKIVSLITFSAAIKIILDLIRPGYLLKRLTNFIKYKGQKKINLFQVQLNKAIQNEQFKLSSQYCYYIHMTYLVLFYSLLVPIAVPITLSLFIMQYWVDKYNLFKRLSSPVDIGYKLVGLTLDIFRGFVLVLAVGNFYWHKLICVKAHRASDVIYIINIVIAFGVVAFHFFAPKYLEEKLLQRLANKQLYTHSYSYYYKNKTFKKFYKNENPATGYLNTQQKQNDKMRITMKFIQNQHFKAFSKIAMDKIFVELYESRAQIQHRQSSLETSQLQQQNTQNDRSQLVIVEDKKEA